MCTAGKIELIKRNMSTILSHGELGCLTWSDPLADEGDLGWETSERNAGLQWGVDVLRRWHKVPPPASPPPHPCARFIGLLEQANNLELTIRAHQLVQHGAWWHQDNKLLTLFSASFYDGQDNYAAMLHVPATDCHSHKTLDPHIIRWRY